MNVFWPKMCSGDDLICCHYVNINENGKWNSDKSLIHVIIYLFTFMYFYLFPTPPTPPKEGDNSLLSECCPVLAQSFSHSS